MERCQEQLGKKKKKAHLLHFEQNRAIPGVLALYFLFDSCQSQQTLRVARARLDCDGKWKAFPGNEVSGSSELWLQPE